MPALVSLEADNHQALQNGKLAVFRSLKAPLSLKALLSPRMLVKMYFLLARQ